MAKVNLKRSPTNLYIYNQFSEFLGETMCLEPSDGESVADDSTLTSDSEYLSNDNRTAEIHGASAVVNVSSDGDGPEVKTLNSSQKMANHNTHLMQKFLQKIPVSLVSSTPDSKSEMSVSSDFVSNNDNRKADIHGASVVVNVSSDSDSRELKTLNSPPKMAKCNTHLMNKFLQKNPVSSASSTPDLKSMSLSSSTDSQNGRSRVDSAEDHMDQSKATLPAHQICHDKHTPQRRPTSFPKHLLKPSASICMETCERDLPKSRKSVERPGSDILVDSESESSLESRTSDLDLDSQSSTLHLERSEGKHDRISPKFFKAKKRQVNTRQEICSLEESPRKHLKSVGCQVHQSLTDYDEGKATHQGSSIIIKGTGNKSEEASHAGVGLRVTTPHKSPIVMKVPTYLLSPSVPNHSHGSLKVNSSPRVNSSQGLNKNVPACFRRYSPARVQEPALKTSQILSTPNRCQGNEPSNSQIDGDTSKEFSKLATRLNQDTESPKCQLDKTPFAAKWNSLLETSKCGSNTDMEVSLDAATPSPRILHKNLTPKLHCSSNRIKFGLCEHVNGSVKQMHCREQKTSDHGTPVKRTLLVPQSRKKLRLTGETSDSRSDRGLKMGTKKNLADKIRLFGRNDSNKNGHSKDIPQAEDLPGESVKRLPVEAHMLTVGGREKRRIQPTLLSKEVANLDSWSLDSEAVIPNTVPLSNPHNDMDINAQRLGTLKKGQSKSSEGATMQKDEGHMLNNLVILSSIKKDKDMKAVNYSTNKIGKPQNVIELDSDVARTPNKVEILRVVKKVIARANCTGNQATNPIRAIGAEMRATKDPRAYSEESLIQRSDNSTPSKLEMIRAMKKKIAQSPASTLSNLTPPPHRSVLFQSHTSTNRVSKHQVEEDQCNDHRLEMKKLDCASHPVGRKQQASMLTLDNLRIHNQMQENCVNSKEITNGFVISTTGQVSEVPFHDGKGRRSPLLAPKSFGAEKGGDSILPLTNSSTIGGSDQTSTPRKKGNPSLDISCISVIPKLIPPSNRIHTRDGNDTNFVTKGPVTINLVDSDDNFCVIQVPSPLTKKMLESSSRAKNNSGHKSSLEKGQIRHKAGLSTAYPRMVAERTSSRSHRSPGGHTNLIRNKQILRAGRATCRSNIKRQKKPWELKDSDTSSSSDSPSLGVYSLSNSTSESDEGFLPGGQPDETYLIASKGRDRGRVRRPSVQESSSDEKSLDKGQPNNNGFQESLTCLGPGKCTKAFCFLCSSTS